MPDENIDTRIAKIFTGGVGFGNISLGWRGCNEA